MRIKRLVYDGLKDKRTHLLLVAINVVVSLLIFNVSSKTYFPDAKGFWLMAESILHGKFSTWYFLNDYYPETLRTPGYPIFLAFCQLFSKSHLFAKILQLLLYFLSIFLVMRTIKKINPHLIYQSVFLLLLIPNIQVVYYTGQISAEILATFSVVLIVNIIFSTKTLNNGIKLAISCYALFIIKPAFLLFPFLLFLFYFIFFKQDRKFSITFISIFVILLIPFGLWNKVNHGQFRVASIEGGAGVAHLGYWQLKLPDGYTEPFYWGNNTMYDLTKPFNYNEEELLNNLTAFENEWGEVISEASRYNTTKDSLNIQFMKDSDDYLFVLYNSEYTLKREQKLWELTIKNIKENPSYYLKSRLYHFIRSYVTGINYKNLNEANSFGSKLKIIYPTIITLTFIFIGLIIATGFVFFKRIKLKTFFPLIMISWYAGVTHLPFAIQARYTMLIHLMILILISILTSHYIKPKHE